MSRELSEGQSDAYLEKLVDDYGAAETHAEQNVTRKALLAALRGKSQDFSPVMRWQRIAIARRNIAEGWAERALKAEAELREARTDSARVDWLDSEHGRVDPVMVLTAKRLYQRDSSEWTNTGTSAREAIDSAMSVTPEVLATSEGDND